MIAVTENFMRNFLYLVLSFKLSRSVDLNGLLKRELIYMKRVNIFQL